MSIRFDDQVAIVTGAGGGLGRAHALEFARRGAKVVVNDLGGDVRGEGGDLGAAQKVVQEIEAAGGVAIADGASVTDPAAVQDMVKKTLDAWGRIDVLVNNAGILRDKSFTKMEQADFDAVVDVHLRGGAICARHVFPIMRDQNYGRIVMTTSSSGLFGNFGQANYGAAKLALVGLMQTLKIEGQKYDVRVNALAPVAATRMTEDLFPPDALALFSPERVTPGLIVLASKDAPNGAILSAGAGVFALAQITETAGVHVGAEPTAEDVRDAWDRIADQTGAKAPFQGAEQTLKFIERATGKSLGG